MKANNTSKPGLLSRTLFTLLFGAMNRTSALLLVFCAISLFAPPPVSAVAIAWSAVGNPGNAADTRVMLDGTTGYGSVPYSYSIDKYDVTSSQYVELLNAKDPTGANTLGLYNSNMSEATYGGISFAAGNPIGSKYSVIAGRGNHPVNDVSWYDSIRFANWLNNGQGSGDTETGAYTLGALDALGVPINGSSITRNGGAKVFLPSENEWYKAAYYNPATSSYFPYPTSSNTAPTAEAPPGGSNSANFLSFTGGGGPNDLTNVGAYAGTTSPYGAFDMAGNVWKWNETLIAGSFRGLRGGSFSSYPNSLLSSIRNLNYNPSNEYFFIGFRVASLPPAYWTGTNSTNWSDSANWSGGVPGALSGMTNFDTALFNQNAPNSPLTVDAGRNIQNITFDTTSVNSLSIGTVGGQALLLTAGGTIQTTSTVINAQTINAPLVLEGDYAFTSNASGSSATLRFGGGITPAATNGLTTLMLNGGNRGANTISGVLADDGAGQLAVTKSGTGVWILLGANTYSGDTTVSAGTLKFNITSGTPTIAAGVTATVASGATFELAGSVSALGTAGGNRVHLVNNSTASGVVVSGTNQVVGGIDGAGNTLVNAGSDLSADHIVQSALVIGGTAGNPGLVTIDVSDAEGNPLTGGLSLAGSLASNGPFGAGIGSTGLIDGAASGGSDFVPTGLSDANSTSVAGLSPVPEPSTLALAGCGLAIIALVGVRRRPAKLIGASLRTTSLQ